MNHLRQFGPWAAGFGFFLLATVPLHAGVVYEIEVKDYEESPPVTESVQAAVEGRCLKDIPAGQRAEIEAMMKRQMPAVQKYLTPSAGGWSAVDHDFVQFLLRALEIHKVVSLEHFTVVANHLRDVDRIVPAVFGTVVINVASVFIAGR